MAHAVKATISEEMRGLSEATTMLRGDLGFGKTAKTKKGALAQMAQFGPVSTHFYDPVSETRTVQTIHDCQAILDDNARQLNSGHDGFSPSRELKKVASIPLGAVEELYAKGIDIMKDEDWPKISSMLDSREWEKFRTSHGIISKRPYRTVFVPVNPR